MAMAQEEIEIIIRQHNMARVKPTRTELALIEAAEAKSQDVCPECKDDGWVKDKVMQGVQTWVGCPTCQGKKQ